MEATFIGVGEACDSNYGNTSILIKDARSGNHLLDCGFSVPHCYFKSCSDPDELDTLWISHFHGDHFFGVPLLLLRLWEMGRRKPLEIVGQKNIAEKIMAGINLAYGSLAEKLQYELNFHVLLPGKEVKIAGIKWQSARGNHSPPCLALTLNDGERKIFYSGDGRPTPETALIASGCDLLIHEAFMLTDEIPGHGSIQGSINFFRQAKAKRLALVHLNRKIRLREKKHIQSLLAEIPGQTGYLPETGEKIIL
jgi:ribonuclease BN (tRNA processing enzyme)